MRVPAFQIERAFDHPGENFDSARLGEKPPQPAEIGVATGGSRLGRLLNRIGSLVA